MNSLVINLWTHLSPRANDATLCGSCWSEAVYSIDRQAWDERLHVTAIRLLGLRLLANDSSKRIRPLGSLVFVFATLPLLAVLFNYFVFGLIEEEYGNRFAAMKQGAH